MDWYIFGMAKERKSPQEKKSLEYTRDHFTFAEHSSFPKTWKRKKTHANREYRRKSDELLVQAKPGMAADDVALIADDLTAALFQKSVVRKPLRKTGTVTAGEKVKLGLAKRDQRVGRRAQSHEAYDRAATLAVRTLTSLDGERLVSAARRAGILCGLGFTEEHGRLLRSSDSLDRALYFLYLLTSGSGREIDALRRNEELGAALTAWVTKANRILARDRRAIEKKVEQKQMAGKKVNALRRATHPIV
ncbi:MAG TPA: hypothetical protein VNY74_06755 [Edaphobacter sp.]|nr:hypothetical protein [Edaphobacter sp.]